MQIQSIPNKNKVLQEAVKKLNQLLGQNKKSPVLLLLSGGSALQLLDGIEAKFLTRDLTFTVLDERYSQEESVNNFAQIARTDFYEMTMRQGTNAIDTRVQNNESQKDLEDRFEKSLRNWANENPKGKIIATMGIGKDSHIAGIMPFKKRLHLFQKMFENKNWTHAYDAKEKNPFPLRVTTTMTFLKKIDSAVVFVTGEEKKDALENTLREKNNLHIFPARIIHQMKNVYLFTDQA